jgi:hypothetical protein
MTSLADASLLAGMIFASGALGLFLQKVLPKPHTSERSRDMIGSVVGTTTLLLALVLGLLIWTAYGVYTAQKTGLQSLVSSALQFDQALMEYGPEANVGRMLLKKQASSDRRQFWEGNLNVSSVPYSEALANVSTSLANMRERDVFLDTLQPATDIQKRLLATARQLTTSMGQTRLSMSLQMDNPVPWPLLAIVISWSLLLFCGAGLLSQINATTLTSMAFGAFSVASAIFLILELNQPYTGLFHVSPAAFERITEDLAK